MSMPPVVNFYNIKNDEDLQVNGWNLGEMEADGDSEVLEVRVWNNRSGVAKPYEDRFVVEQDGDEEFYIPDEDKIELELTNVPYEDPEDGVELTVRAVQYTEESQPTEVIEDTNITLNSQTLTISNFGEPQEGTRFEVSYYTTDDFLTSEMRDCVMYVRDENEAKAQEVVAQGWISGKCDSLGDSSFLTLDGDAELDIGAEGLQEAGEDPIYNIAGTENSGLDTDTENYADVTLEMQVPYGATATTNKPFYVYVRYLYT